MSSSKPNSRLRQVMFLPPLSPYDQVRTKWTRLVLAFLMVPLVYKLYQLRKTDESTKGPFRSLNSLNLNDRLRTQLAYSQIMRNNGTSLPLDVFENGMKIHIEIPLEDLCEKGFSKASKDCVAAAKSAADAAQ